MSDRNKIAQSLPVEELDAFIRELMALPGSERTYAGIQRHAAARGIVVSIEGAKSFRKTTFANYLARVERRREFAERVTAAPATGSRFADAAGENLAELIFDATEEMSDAADEGGSLDLKKAGAMAFIISKIRQGDVARERLAILQFDAAAEALKHAAELKTIAENKEKISHEEQVERVRFRLFGAAPAGAK
jgi:hypothetical protein